MPGQKRHVLQLIPERRQFDFKGVDAIPKIFAELAGRDHFVQMPVGGADHAHIAGERLVIAHAADLAAFQEAEQFGLERLGQFADFIQKERAAIGQFNKSGAMFVGAGEGPFAMAEKFAFD